MLINPYAFGYTPTDSNAAAYIAAVEAAEGASLESGVKQAIDNFVIGCKADGIWTAILSSCIFVGARTLAGALVPLAGTAPTNNNFVSGDYNRKTGLIGNASSKHINTNRKSNDLPDANLHISVYVSQTGATAGAYIANDAGNSNTEFSALYPTPDGKLVFYNRNINGAVGGNIFNSASASVGFMGSSRSSSSGFLLRYNGTNASYSQSNYAATAYNFRVFCRTSLGALEYFSNARLAFYSIGTSLDLVRLDSRVTTLINAIAAAIP